MNITDLRPNLEGYPKTYVAVAGRDRLPTRPQVFDPSLKQFPRAFRFADPIFVSPEIADRWKMAQRDVVRHLLLWISQSRWQSRLVLRGSLLMKAWFGDEAREPGDTDWVVRPASIELDSYQSHLLFAEIAQAARANPQAGIATIQSDRIATDNIWTYDRVPGRRVVFPWEAPGIPAGAVQMDFVFGEELWQEPVLTSVYDTAIWAATKEVSLAWKLLWLYGDKYPQGKDMYDATLLAEATTLDALLLHQVLSTDWHYKEYLNEPYPQHFNQHGIPDWDEFRSEYPWVNGTGSEWKKRLNTALASTFENWDEKIKQ